MLRVNFLLAVAAAILAAASLVRLRAGVLRPLAGNRSTRPCSRRSASGCVLQNGELLAWGGVGPEHCPPFPTRRSCGPGLAGAAPARRAGAALVLILGAHLLIHRTSLGVPARDFQDGETVRPHGIAIGRIRR